MSHATPHRLLYFFVAFVLLMFFGLIYARAPPPPVRRPTGARNWLGSLGHPRWYSRSIITFAPACS
ncbi:MAG: hypothetical protein ACLTDR_02465 [Adlercreutzia equolifaciens]